MTGTSHENLVTQQFGPRAAAYVGSAVHAQGEDLLQLAALLRGRKAARVLDLGCGGGHVSFHVAPEVGEIVAYDLSDEMLAAVTAEASRRKIGNLVTRRGAVEALPFEDASFDAVLSRFSAHHWHHWEKGLAEARRVVKPTGIVAFADCVSPGAPMLDTYLQGIELLRDPSHVRDYSVAEWRQALTRAGFAPGAVTERRLRLDFASWIARMETPPIQRDAIRALQQVMAKDVVEHFAIESDGSFTIDTAVIEAKAV
jgi:SAM-dependent methyltransferase